MRRTKGEGTIFRRKDGRWSANIDVGMIEGRRRRKTIYGKSRKEVADKLYELRKQVEQGDVPTSGKATVGDFLDRWLETSAKASVRATTLASYRAVVRNHLVPKLGREKLARLSPMKIQAAYTAMETAGTGARTRQLAHAVLHRALNQAVRWGYIPRNPAALVTRPKVKSAEAHAPSDVEIGHAPGRAPGAQVEGHRLSASSSECATYHRRSERSPAGIGAQEHEGAP
jgi:hypothetical protein